jgi:predicted  nucleic acid-binding Zn-ribbon protein
VTIETLTAEERAQVNASPYAAAEKALRIIDTHAADRMALVDQATFYKREAERWEACATDLHAEKTRLEAERAALVERVEKAERDCWAYKAELRQVGKSVSGQTTAPMVHFMNAAERAEFERNALAATLERALKLLSIGALNHPNREWVKEAKALVGAPAPKGDEE